VAALAQQILGDPEAARAALQYGTTEGLASLREALFEHLIRLDDRDALPLPGTADDIVVSTGSQQLLHILTDLLVDPGDVVITGWPSYFVYTGALTSFGATVRCVDLDEQGMIPQRLERLLSGLEAAGQLGRVKIVYVCSYHQNPTGLTLSEQRRAELLEIVKRYSKWQRILLIEDAAYRELTYEGAPPGSIKRHDQENDYVALLQTFSKPFSPGLKTGYGLLPRDLVEPVRRAKGGRDFGSNNFAQHLIDRALRTGVFDDHLTRLCAHYAQKRDQMLAALEAHLGEVDGVSWTRPRGGLYVWLTLPEAVDTGRRSELFTRAIEAGVLFVPGAYCYPADPTRAAPGHTIRLSFGVPSAGEIEEGIARLAEAVKAVV